MREVKPSLEREPWRALLPSLAIQFVSEGRRDWDSDAIPDHTRADILSALMAHRSTRLSYAELNSCVRDILRDTIHLPSFGVSDRERRDALRELVLAEDSLANHRKPVLTLLDWLGDAEQELELLSTGFIEVREHASGQVSLTFQLYRQRRRLGTEELRSRATDLTRVLKFGTTVLRGVGQRLGIN